ncbi:MAG: tyrosine-type recombinase/integrase [Lachnospiraceae bacterium]|nr:tyrosine-type recombinase/integrase [Lachnospiraceae bacterium]
MAVNKSKSNTYRTQNDINNIAKLRVLLKEDLPSFAGDYFRGIENTTTTKTRLNYAYDIRVFFRFLKANNPELEKLPIKSITLEHLDRLEPVDIEEYLNYLKYYDYEGVTYTNDERGIHRKLAALRSFFLYYQKRNLLKNNPTVVVDMPKLHKREIVRLDDDEVQELLDLVENGGKDLTGMKKVYYEKNKLRNIAIFTLLLGTGIRVSECVGLDINDIDFRDDRIRIIRKGGKEEYIYFGAEVKDALANYINNERTLVSAKEGHENALFYSIQKRRMTVQAVENLVNDFASKITTFKHITPHKLRSTYGTNLYRSTDDIYLVAEVLGHNDVNTTRRYYAAMDDDKKRSAADAVQLRSRKKR